MTFETTSALLLSKSKVRKLRSKRRRTNSILKIKSTKKPRPKWRKSRKRSLRAKMNLRRNRPSSR